MDWVKLATRYYLDSAIANLPDADCEVMFTRGLAYAGDEEKGGFIAAGVLPALCRIRRYEACAETLVRAGLWLPTRGGYQVAHWEEWQSELDAITRRRSADRERKRRERADKKAQLNGMSRDMSEDGHADSPHLESKKDTPKSPRSGDHRGQHKNCRVCGTNPRGPSPPTPTPPPAADVLGGSGNGHVLAGEPPAAWTKARSAIKRKEAM